MGIETYGFAVNPEPWAIGPISVGRNKATGKSFPRVGPNGNQVAFQDAVQAALIAKGVKVLPGHYSLMFYFSRKVFAYTKNEGKAAHRNIADGTNMMKAAEDALQGVLIDNDRNVIQAQWSIMEQSPTAEPWMVVTVRHSLEVDHVSHMQQFEQHTLDEALDARDEQDVLQGNEWKP